MLCEWVNDRSKVFILDLDGTLMPTAKIDKTAGGHTDQA